MQSDDEDLDWFAELGSYLRPGEVALMLDEVVVKGRPKGNRIKEYSQRAGQVVRAQGAGGAATAQDAD